MGFTTNPNSVRAEVFKPNGKRYQTLALTIPNSKWEHWDIWTAYKKAYEKEAGHPLGEGWHLVIFDPYNKNSHPIMIIGDNNDA